jgi:hypothetical protein
VTAAINAASGLDEEYDNDIICTVTAAINAASGLDEEYASRA